MAGDEIRLERPARVVVFSSGPILENGVRRFLARLEEHPQIELLACFAQARVKTRRAAYAALWRRRGLLALPILISQGLDAGGRLLFDGRAERDVRRWLAGLGGRLVFVSDIHAPEVLEQVRRLEPDLGLIYGSPILRPELFEIPRMGTLGIHHGELPKYRGKKTMFWAMYNGEALVGVTIQKVNAGLDTGLIVREGRVAAENRLPGRVWKELDGLGRDLYIQAILEVCAGTAQYRPQEGPKGRLYRDPRAQDVLRLRLRIAARWIRGWFR